MSRATNALNFKGRFNKAESTSNLVNPVEDFAEFEPYEGAVVPRGWPTESSLAVVSVDMCQQMNKQSHMTSAYNTANLVVRRGQEFFMKVTFSRALSQGDDFQVEFLIGANPSPNKGSLVAVAFGSRSGGPWLGQILEMQGQTVMLGITPAADAIVGKFRVYVAIMAAHGMQRTHRDATTDVYLLFNAWCPEDATFYPDAAGRMEYVLNDSGVIFQGSANAMSQRSWIYGQFERGILDACIQILDASRMPIYGRGDVIKLVRVASAMVNSQDDNGVCVGNWSEDYSMGKSPTAWTGSVPILLQYANTGVPVSYAQCWVFAGVLNTLLRCLGIPTRLITTFNSAHDNTGNLKLDLIFKTDGTPDRRNTRDSIWNYHCWNEVFITRPDLPPGLGGWQVVDSTPQETSDGYYRCGPSPVAAIRSGTLCHQYDCKFVFAEVNADVVYHKRDRYGNLTPFKVDKTHVGSIICTKSVGSPAPEYLTDTYKPREGTAEDSATMANAESYGCVRDHSEFAENELSVSIHCEKVRLSEDVHLAVDFHNRSAVPHLVKAHLAGSVIFYTGVTAATFKDEHFTVTVLPNHIERVVLKVLAVEYLPHLGSQLSLHFIVTAHTDSESTSTTETVELETPTLSMTVSGMPKVQQEMFVTASFTNPFSFPLQNVTLSMEGAGVMDCKSRNYSVIEPLSTVSCTESVIPRLDGHRCVVAILDCSKLRQVRGSIDVIVAKP